MARLRRSNVVGADEAGSLRLRAAWLYYNHGLTQKDVADQLGIGRTTVIRLLDEARRRGEVRFWIEEGEARCVELALKLEAVLGLDEAIVVPGGGDVDGTARAVGLALGRFLSEGICDGMTIGVGWGRTLTASLASFRPPQLDRCRVLSLLGGAVDTQFANPMDFSWQLADRMAAECYLYPAPLLVDTAATKTALSQRCGLGRLYAIAERLDLAVLSVGDIGPRSTSLVRHLVGADEMETLVGLGAVGDILCNFLDASGATVPHTIADRVMSIDLATIARAGHIALACGGAHRAAAILAAIRRVGCHTLVTDEDAGRALLNLAA